MTDHKYLGKEIRVSDYISFLKRQIVNIESAIIGHEDEAIFTELPVIKVINNKTLGEDDFEAISEFIWEADNE